MSNINLRLVRLVMKDLPSFEGAKTSLSNILDWDAMHFGAKTHLNLTHWPELSGKKDDTGFFVYGTK